MKSTDALAVVYYPKTKPASFGVSFNNNQPTTMKYYVFLIAMKDTNGNIYPHEVAAPSISDAIDFLIQDTGMTYAYEIKPL